MTGDGDPDPYVALIPGGGWMIWDALRGWSTPVIAWAMDANGDVVALETDRDGLVWPLDPTEDSHEILASRYLQPPRSGTPASPSQPDRGGW